MFPVEKSTRTLRLEKVWSLLSALRTLPLGITSGSCRLSCDSMFHSISDSDTALFVQPGRNRRHVDLGEWGMGVRAESMAESTRRGRAASGRNNRERTHTVMPKA